MNEKKVAAQSIASKKGNPTASARPLGVKMKSKKYFKNATVASTKKIGNSIVDGRICFLNCVDEFR